MMERKFAACALVAAMLLTGCGGGGGGGGSSDSGPSAGSPETNSPGSDAESGATVDPRAKVNALTFSYDGQIKSVAVSGHTFDPMADEVGPTIADSCVAMDDRFYDNGFVRVYSDGGATDAELKAAGDQALGTLDMALTASKLTLSEFGTQFFSNLHPKTVREILDNYAVNGVPYYEYDEVSGTFYETRSPLHEAVIDIGVEMDEQDKALYAAGSLDAYRAAVSDVLLDMTPEFREYALSQLQQVIAGYVYHDPDSGPTDGDATGGPSGGIGLVDDAALASDPMYAPIFDKPLVDPTVNICLLSQGNVPADFTSEVGINSVTVATGADNVAIGKAMAEVVGLHLATTYRYDYVAAMPFWFTEGLAFGLLVPEYDAVSATKLVEQDALVSTDLEEESYATIVEALEAATPDLFMMDLYYAQRLIGKDPGDPAAKGFDQAFSALVEAPGYPNLSYTQFQDNFASIMNSIL